MTFSTFTFSQSIDSSEKKEIPQKSETLDSIINHEPTAANYYLKGYLKNKIKYSAYFESDILASVVRAAVDGISFCLIPLPYIKKELQNESLEILPKMAALWKHQLYVVARNDKDKGHFVKKLISEIELAI